MSQWIRADDFNSRIAYSSTGWTALQLSGMATLDYDFPNLQDAFLGTAHVVVGTDYGTQSSFSFAFNGTGVAVYGMFHGLSSVCVQNCTVANVIPPSWACFVDGVSIPSNQPFGHFPWQSYCEKDDLSDGPHVISAQIFHRNVSEPSGFYLDFIQYLPSLSSLSSGLDSGYLMINSTDSQLTFAKDWQTLGSAKMTQDEDFFFLEFTGIWLAWYSLSKYAISVLDPSLLNQTSGALLWEYTIDGGNPISFAIFVGPDASNTTTYNNVFLQTPSLSAGKHNLSITATNPVDSNGYPITLDYLIVQQAPPVADTAAPTSTSPLTSPLATQVNNPTHSHHMNVGAVAGGAIGGTLLIIALIISLVMVKKRRKSCTTDGDSVLETDPLPGTIKLEPFRDSVEKTTATALPGGSDSSTLIARTAPSLQPKNRAPPRLHSSTAISVTSSSNSPLPLISPTPPLLENIIDPFTDPGFFKPSSATQSALSLCVSDAQASTSSLHSHSQLLPAEEVSRANSHPPISSSPLTDGSKPRHVNPPAIETTASQNPEEQTEVLNIPRPSPPMSISRSTPSADDRRISRSVRHADSGIRLSRARNSANILELPPEYTVE
ncbi:hypothetical protein BJ912DRAFT_923469 [Pholiota molesta]|nr:hypothetical protein BJ912DRAFT_923469 [Pholiota molesta]